MRWYVSELDLTDFMRVSGTDLSGEPSYHVTGFFESRPRALSRRVLVCMYARSVDVYTLAIIAIAIATPQQRRNASTTSPHPPAEKLTLFQWLSDSRSLLTSS